MGMYPVVYTWFLLYHNKLNYHLRLSLKIELDAGGLNAYESDYPWI